MKKLYILLTGLLVGMGVLQAQEPEKNEAVLDRTVVVENLYNPDIMNANKISLLPTLEEPQINKKQIEYATSTKPAGQFTFAPMSSFGVTPQQIDAKDGFLRLGYGNRGNIDGRLAYRLEWGKRDMLNANVALRGMDGVVKLPETIENNNEWDIRTYRTQGNVNWEHKFDSHTLVVETDVENQVFNYMNFSPWIDNTHQHNVLGSVNAVFGRNDADAEIWYRVGTGLLYAKQKYAFGYYDADKSESYAETIIRSHAHAKGDIDEVNSVHLFAQMDNIFLNPGGGYNGASQTVIQLNPYLVSYGDKWNARVGMHLDPIFGSGGAEVAFAPDLCGEYNITKGYTAYVQIGGGRVLNDFRTINRFDPYAEFPVYGSDSKGEGYYTPKHAFHQLDSRIGFKATPLNELALQTYVGFGKIKNQLFSIYREDYSYGRLNQLMQDDAKRVYVGASVQGSWKDYLTTRASFEWNRWTCDLLDKYSTLTPEISFQWAANISPVEKLNVELSYQYQQYRKGVKGDRFDAMSNVGISASYRFLDWLSAYVQGDNLLNSKYYQYLMLPAQGINVLGGVVLDF